MSMLILMFQIEIIVDSIEHSMVTYNQFSFAVKNLCQIASWDFITVDVKNLHLLV